MAEPGMAVAVAVEAAVAAAPWLSCPEAGPVAEGWGLLEAKNAAVVLAGMGDGGAAATSVGISLGRSSTSSS